jgi:hypothetical protein
MPILFLLGVSGQSPVIPTPTKQIGRGATPYHSGARDQSRMAETLDGSVYEIPAGQRRAINSWTERLMTKEPFRLNHRHKSSGHHHQGWAKLFVSAEKIIEHEIERRRVAVEAQISRRPCLPAA